uniref:Uncharacterized protein n=1 Tax=Globisporangium ultimum (strain ATCC 200006 / CBS 805.95 / DAOM BR144) TaxID=431595 RepID=K3X236_GLOUD
MPADAPQKRNVPTLSAKHFVWWTRTYGPKYQIASASSPSAPAAAAAHARHHNSSSKGDVPIAAVERLFQAIRANRKEIVEQVVERHPHIVFAKGDHKRTPLYVASFFARHELVKYFLSRGADKNLRCEGFRPVDVAGYGRDDAVDCMKVQFLLGEEACPHVIICTANEASVSSSSAALPAATHSDTYSIRLHIHFSEPVEDFITDDIVVSNPSCCRITSFSMVRSDFYRVDLAVTTSDFRGIASSDGGNANAKESSSSLYVEVPEGVARRPHTAQVFNSRSNRFVLLLVPAQNSQPFGLETHA